MSKRSIGVFAAQNLCHYCCLALASINAHVDSLQPCTIIFYSFKASYLSVTDAFFYFCKNVANLSERSAKILLHLWRRDIEGTEKGVYTFVGDSISAVF